VIEINNINKRFGSNHVLKDVSINIDKGDKVVIIGPSGSGKSTLLRCMNLLEVPDSGSIFFEEQNITSKKCDINKIRQKMGMVFQHFNLFPHLTVMENITLAPTATQKLHQISIKRQWK
jgi:ABC-type polar amino acid transport system ATPase subunit